MKEKSPLTLAFDRGAALRAGAIAVGLAALVALGPGLLGGEEPPPLPADVGLPFGTTGPTGASGASGATGATGPSRAERRREAKRERRAEAKARAKRRWAREKARQARVHRRTAGATSTPTYARPVYVTPAPRPPARPRDPDEFRRP